MRTTIYRVGITRVKKQLKAAGHDVDDADDHHPVDGHGQWGSRIQSLRHMHSTSASSRALKKKRQKSLTGTLARDMHYMDRLEARMSHKQRPSLANAPARVEIRMSCASASSAQVPAMEPRARKSSIAEALMHGLPRRRASIAAFISWSVPMRSSWSAIGSPSRSIWAPR